MELWSELPYPEEAIFLTKDEELAQEIVDAKGIEMDELSSNEVFKVVPFVNQRTISSRWVITERFKKGKRKLRARLVARGFEEDSSKYRKDSPTC